MFCPKCHAKIGLYECKIPTSISTAQGLSCCMCGYWLGRDMHGMTANQPQETTVSCLQGYDLLMA